MWKLYGISTHRNAGKKYLNLYGPLVTAPSSLVTIFQYIVEVI